MSVLHRLKSLGKHLITTIDTQQQQQASALCSCHLFQGAAVQVLLHQEVVPIDVSGCLWHRAVLQHVEKLGAHELDHRYPAASAG
jgi:hypothetical protein